MAPRGSVGTGWWVVDAPWTSDPLAWIALVAGAMAALIGTAAGDQAVAVVVDGVGTALVVATVLGIGRGYRRGRATGA